MHAETDSERIIVAYDFPTRTDLENMANLLKGERLKAKIGMELTTAIGVPAALQPFGPGEVFLDLKYKDIPNTVAGAIRSAARQGVWMVNVHCDGGPEMMKRAAEAAHVAGAGLGFRPLVIGVTVLTSLTRQMLDLLHIKESLTMPQIVGDLAALAETCGLDGVVCSPLEVREVRSRVGKDFLIVTPGIRSANDPPDDQNRTATPAEAISAGSDYVVVGRPITKSDDPLASARSMAEEVRSARARLGKELSV